MKIFQNKPLLATAIVSLIGLYFYMPFVILTSIITKQETYTGNPIFTKGKIYNFMYVPLLEGLGKDNWYVLKIQNHVKELCSKYPESCDDPDN